MLLSRDPQTVELHRQTLRPGLRLNPIESNGGVIPDEETDAVIRTVLAADVSEMAATLPRLRGRRALPDIAHQDEMAPGTTRRTAKRRSQTIRPAEAPAAPPTAPVEQAMAAFSNNITPADDSMTQQVRAIAEPETCADTDQQPGRVAPKPRGDQSRRLRWIGPALMMALGVAVLLRPILILLPLFMAFWGLMIFVVVLGGGSFGEGYGRIYRWHKARSPKRAERLRLGLDRLAERVDGLLDRLPTAWADTLALPDFSRAALDPDLGDTRPDPFERIAHEAHS